MRRLLHFASALLFSLAAVASPVRAEETEPLPVNVFKNLQAGQKRTVVVYGTSLTIMGAWTKALNEYFDAKFPGQVTFINAAKAGMHSDWGVQNFEERVLSKQPDLLFIEFSINDAAPKNNVSLEKSKANLEAMIKAVREKNPRVDIVLQTMNAAWDSPRVPEKKYGSDRPDLATYYSVYRDYAREHKLPLVDNYPVWLKRQKDDPEGYQKGVPDGIHPSSTTSRAVAWPAVEALLEKARTAAAAK